MGIGVIVQELWDDWQVKAFAVLITLDFILGIAASLKRGDFRLSYIASFLKDDVAFKLVPYMAVAGAAVVAGDTTIIFGLDLGDAAGAAAVALGAAWVGSIASSLLELGLGPKPEEMRPRVANLLGKENPPPGSRS